MLSGCSVSSMYTCLSDFSPHEFVPVVNPREWGVLDYRLEDGEFGF